MMYLDFVLRISLAMALGFLIGLERQADVGDSRSDQRRMGGAVIEKNNMLRSQTVPCVLHVLHGSMWMFALAEAGMRILVIPSLVSIHCAYLACSDADGSGIIQSASKNQRK